MPRAGHCSAAIANASATASSARSMSPRTRIRVAVQRPASRRKTPARSSATFGGSDLDRALAGGGGLAGPLERGVEIGGFDDPEPAHLLLGLRVRAIGHRHVAVARAHDGRRRCRAQAAAEHPGAGLLERLVERADLAADALELVVGVVEVAVVVVVPNGKQVLRHGVSLLVRSW